MILLLALKIALSSPLGPEQAARDAKQLAAAMTETLHEPVEAQVAGHEELPALLAEGKVDLAWLSSGQFSRAKAAVPVAKVLRGGLPFYRSAVFVRKKGVRRLTDLKGKRLAFVSAQSGAGYLRALEILLAVGFTERDLRGRKFLGNHAAVCKAVLDGTADGGATFANDGRGGPLAGCAETVGERARDLRVLATSEPIPNDLVAARPGAPPELIRRVRAALTSMPRQTVDAIFHADGFVP